MNFADVLPDSLRNVKKFNVLTKFATPAIERAVELTANSWVDEKIQADKTNMNEIIRSRITLLYTKNQELDLTTATNENTFRAMFALSQADIPELKPEGEYAVFNKEMVKYAFQFMKEMRTELVELRQQINERPAEENETKFNEVKADYAAKISETQQRITNQVENEFAIVGEAINNLANNQIKLQTDLDDIKKGVIDNKNELERQEKQMQGLKKEITTLQNNVTQINQKVAQLNNIQNLHSKLIAENSFKIDVLTKYTFMGLKPKVQLEGLKKGDFNNIFPDKEKRDQLEKKLERIVTAETIVSVSNDIAQYSSIGYNFLVENNILKGEDAKKAGKFLHYLVSASQVVTGAARMYGGDMTGAFSVIQGLGGLFGGQKKPQPSPEMQMLRAVYKKLEAIHKDVIKIQEDIANFRNDVIEMYKSLSASLDAIANQLDTIEWKTDGLRQITSTLLFQKYQVCASDYQDKRNINIAKYSDYGNFYTTNTGRCLRELSLFTDSSEDTYFYLSAVSPSTNPNEFADREIREVYIPTRDLYRRIYPSPTSPTNELIKLANNRLMSLMFPVAKTNETLTPFLKIKNLTDPIPRLGDQFLNNYLNYEMILEFSQFFLIYSPYLEIAWDDPDFRPQPLEQYLQRKENQQEISKNAQSRRVQKLIRLTESSIKQQSLLAGNGILDEIHAILFNSSPKREDVLAVNKVLKNNKLLAYNFATFWLNKNLSSNPENYKTFIPLIEEIRSKQTASKEQLDNLNKFLTKNINSTTFSFTFKDKDKKLYLSYKKEGEDVDILVPESSVIIENRMINPASISLLMSMRETLSEKLLDQNFTANIPKEDFSYMDADNQEVKVSSDDYFKYIFANSTNN